MVDQTPLPPVVITGKDETSEAWDSLKRNAKQTGDALDALKARLDQGFGGGDGGVFGKIEKLSGAFGKLRGAVGGPALAIGGVLAGTAVAATLVHSKLSDIGQAAEETGRKASEIDNLDRVLGRVGGKAGDAADAVKSLRKAIDEAAQGEGTQVDALDDLFELNNVKLTDAAGKVKSLGAVYQDVSKLIVNAANETDRLAIATIAFGEDAAEPMVRAILDGATGLEKMGTSGDHALDEITKRAREFDAMLKTLTGSADTFARRLGDGLKGHALPVMQFLYERGTEIGAMLGSKSAQFNLMMQNSRRAGMQVSGPMTQSDIDAFYNATGMLKSPTKVRKPDDDDETKNAFDRQVASIAKHIAAVEADAKAVDKTAGEHARLRAEAKLLEAAQQAGIPVIGETAKKFEELTKRALAAGDAYAFAKLKSDIFFERGQIGRSEIEQRVAQQLRSAGIDAKSEQGQFLADQIRINATLAETKDLGKDALKGLVEAMRDGKIEGRELAEILGRIGSKLSDKSLDFGLSLLFKGLGGAGSGFGGDATFGGFSLAGSSVAAVKMHLGGTVGWDGVPMSVPAHLFTNARRMHGGGPVLRSDEVPIIGQVGERMLPKGAARSGGGYVDQRSFTFDARGADPAAIARLERLVAMVKASSKSDAMSAMQEYQERYA